MPCSCTDYKGKVMLGNNKYCYPLTVTDYASCFLLLCEAIESDPEHFAFTAFERLFKERCSRKRCARVTAFPLPRLTGCLISQNSQPGDYAWPSASNACIPVIPNRMAAMNACT
jgi:hypothetical protein